METGFLTRAVCPEILSELFRRLTDVRRKWQDAICPTKKAFALIFRGPSLQQASLPRCSLESRNLSIHSVDSNTKLLHYCQFCFCIHWWTAHLTRVLVELSTKTSLSLACLCLVWLSSLIFLCFFTFENLSYATVTIFLYQRAVSFIHWTRCFLKWQERMLGVVVDLHFIRKYHLYRLKRKEGIQNKVFGRLPTSTSF